MKLQIKSTLDAFHSQITQNDTDFSHDLWSRKENFLKAVVDSSLSFSFSKSFDSTLKVNF